MIYPIPHFYVVSLIKELLTCPYSQPIPRDVIALCIHATLLQRIPSVNLGKERFS